MDTIDGMKAFVTAVDAGSFTAASQRLGISKKLVSKYVAQLEDRFRVRLLHRTTRRLSLTDAGARHYDQCLKLIEDFDAMESTLRDDRRGVHGTLRLSAPLVFGELYLLPLITEFRKDHPDLSIDLQLSDRFVDLADEGFDLAIRFGALDQSSIIAKQLAKTENWLVASPSFVKKHGAPKDPQDLANFECIYDTNLRSGRNWRFQVDGEISSVTIKGKMSVNSLTAAKRLALNGQGIALCPDYAVVGEIAQERLLRLLPHAASLVAGVHLVYLDSRYMPARVRTFIDYVADRFADMTVWKRFEDD